MLQLRDISDDLMKRADVLKGITPPQLECLTVFTSPDCEEFVNWVRKEVSRKCKSNALRQLTNISIFLLSSMYVQL